MVARGTSVGGGDPRVAGDFTGEVVVRLHQLVELATGDGYERGTLAIRRPESRRPTVQARFDNADTDEISQGSLLGKVAGGSNRGGDHDDDDGEDDRGFDLVANWRITFHENGAITAQVGGVERDGRLPSLIVRGQCKGPFERAEFELPPPGAPATMAARAGSGARRWGR